MPSREKKLDAECANWAKWSKEEFSTFVTLNIPELQSRCAVDLWAPIWCDWQTQHSTTDLFLSQNHTSVKFLRYISLNIDSVPFPKISYSHILYPV